MQWLAGNPWRCDAFVSARPGLHCMHFFTLFVGWFQPGLFNPSTVFFSHNKPAPASSNQPRNQPANTPLLATTPSYI